MNVGCSSFLRYTNDDLNNYTNQSHQHRKWEKEDNKFALCTYFRSNPTQRGYRKRTIEIWKENARFQPTCQRLADQIRTITKKGWFSDHKIWEIYQQINKESRRCSWCNGYRRRKWTRWHEFKSWTRLIAFHIARKVWIQLFSLQLWLNSRTDWVLQPWWGN